MKSKYRLSSKTNFKFVSGQKLKKSERCMNLTMNVFKSFLTNLFSVMMILDNSFIGSQYNSEVTRVSVSK